ncbi:FAD-binding protein [Prosthecobacter sp.]|uniref:FAD-binding protein n=1 Tax=Prosthecobacter sp. TaxID=1965333 RepID=UPI003782E241
MMREHVSKNRIAYRGRKQEKCAVMPTQAEIETVQNFLNNIPSFKTEVYKPANLKELVAIMKNSKTAAPVRAVGTKYSLNSNFVVGGATKNQGSIINTDGLNKVLNDNYPGASPGKTLLYVEAGIKIRHLLEYLHKKKLALPTMGAGGAQSLAGALSTATHGGDLNESVLGDHVKAFHLVKANGEESWVVPVSNKVPMPRKGKDWPTSDDGIFRALQTSVGRLGIIYAVVLEVEPAYQLVEVNEACSWRELKTALKKNPDDKSLLSRPIFTQDLHYKSCCDGVKAMGNLKWEKAGGKQGASPPWKGLVQSMCTYKEKGEEKLRLPLHHLNIVLSLANPNQCWITRRWKDDGYLFPSYLEPKAEDTDLAKFLRKHAVPAKNLLGELKHELAQEIAKEQTKKDCFGIIAWGPVRNIVIRLLVLLQTKGSTFDMKEITEKESYIIPTGDIEKAVEPYYELANWLCGMINKELPDVLEQPYESEQIYESEEERAGELAVHVMHRMFIDQRIKLPAELRSWLEKAIQATEKALGKTRDKLEGDLAEKSGSDRTDWLKKLQEFRNQWSTKEAFESLKNGKTMRDLFNVLTAQIFSSQVGDPLRCDDSNKILDTHDYNTDGLMGARSAEYFFDASKDDFLDFIEDVRKLAEEKYPVLGYVGIRFMRKAAGLISMQRWDLTVSVEVTTLAARRQQVHRMFELEVETLSSDAGAIPHWGQIFTKRNSLVEMIKTGKVKGDIVRDFEHWKQVLRKLDPEGRFETEFSKMAGLNAKELEVYGRRGNPKVTLMPSYDTRPRPGQGTKPAKKPIGLPSLPKHPPRPVAKKEAPTSKPSSKPWTTVSGKSAERAKDKAKEPQKWTIKSSASSAPRKSAGGGKTSAKTPTPAKKAADKSKG